MFNFIYFVPDPSHIAHYYGYTPLEDLPAVYTREDAFADGCLVILNNVIQNIEVYNNIEYIDNIGMFLRIYTEDESGIKIQDIASPNSANNRDERVVVSTDYSRLFNPPMDLYTRDFYCFTVISGENRDGILYYCLNHSGGETTYIINGLRWAEQ